MTIETATLAGGCFWCTEAVFNDVIGVQSVREWLYRRTMENPTYKEVCTGTTGHAEAIRVGFDTDQISYGELLDTLLATHDPTQLNRQGNDIGTQYRSAIFPHSAEQAAEAEAAIERARPDWPQPIDEHRAAGRLVAGRGLPSGILAGRGPAESLLPGRDPAQAGGEVLAARATTSLKEGRA